MRYQRQPLTGRYYSFVKKSQHLSPKEFLAQGLSLLKDVQETGQFLVNPEQRSILHTLARDIGSRLFDISGQFPALRVAYPLDLAWEIEPDVTLAQLQAYILMRCHRTLFKFREFDCDELLRECFITQTLVPYRDALPITTSKTERILKTTAYLLQKQFSDEQPVLLEFLAFLRDREPLASGLREEVDILLSAMLPLLHDTSEQPWEAPAKHLTFVNRELIRERIWSLLLPDFYVQLLAPSGYGKTYLLRQLQREIGLWRAVWIDFASTSHQPIRANRRLFLQAFYQQVFGTMLPVNHAKREDDEKIAVAQIGDKLASIDQEILLFLDHVEWADEELLTWIGEAFLVKLATQWVPVRVIAASRKLIEPWQGMTGQRSFQLLRLSPLDESEVIEQMINDVSERFGTEPSRQGTQKVKAWQDNLNIMASELLQISGGHPLRIAYLLRYAAEQDGTYPLILSHWANLSPECLAKVVDEYILPTIDESVRQAFPSLCIFRYLWPSLIRSFIEGSDELDHVWKPFSTSCKPWRDWWEALKETLLIDKPRPHLMRPINPIIRQLIAKVLQYEDEALYHAHHRVALQKYEQLLTCQPVFEPRHAAYLLEVFYHTTQESKPRNSDVASAFKEKLNYFLKRCVAPEAQELLASSYAEKKSKPSLTWQVLSGYRKGESVLLGSPQPSSLKVASQLLTGLHEDRELQAAINQLAGPELYVELIQIVDHFIQAQRGRES